VAKRKWVPAIERTFATAFVAAMGGIVLGVAGGNLLPVFPEVSSAVWILAGFFGLIVTLAAIVSAICYDDEVTKLVELIYRRG